jgi:hypothetical protein
MSQEILPAKLGVDDEKNQQIVANIVPKQTKKRWVRF